MRSGCDQPSELPSPRGRHSPGYCRDQRHLSQAPANPLFTGTVTSPSFAAVNPDLKKDLLMKPGDSVRIHIQDTPAGMLIQLNDLTTGQHGSMTASVANGFGHILFTPKSKTCQEAPYAFHPAYSTANPRGNVWTAHTYNVAFSDEIGHFENCLAVNTTTGACTKPAGKDKTLDADDTACVPATGNGRPAVNLHRSLDGLDRVTVPPLVR